MPPQRRNAREVTILSRPPPAARRPPYPDQSGPNALAQGIRNFATTPAWSEAHSGGVPEVVIFR